jgi:phage terminase large subunit-like protein
MILIFSVNLQSAGFWGLHYVSVATDAAWRTHPALAVQANFANGMIYAPNRDWAELVITEMEVFPKGRYDDLTDSATQAIKYTRDNGLLRTDDEEQFWALDGVRH